MKSKKLWKVTRIYHFGNGATPIAQDYHVAAHDEEAATITVNLAYPPLRQTVASYRHEEITQDAIVAGICYSMRGSCIRTCGTCDGSPECSCRCHN